MDRPVSAEVAKGMTSGVNFEGKLTRKGEVRTVNLKRGGTADVCDMTLTDAGGGQIDLTLWGDDISKVTEGCTVRINNGYINEFKGKKSLTKGKFGHLEVV